MQIACEKIHEGEQVPRGYGLAYWMWERDAGVFMPIPFNFIVRWMTTVYHWFIRLAHPDLFEEMLANEYSRGHRGGYESCDRLWEERLRIIKEIKG